jgi:hypothetical protein
VLVCKNKNSAILPSGGRGMKLALGQLITR